MKDNEKIQSINDEEMEKASGGSGGSGGIIEVTCPGCGHVYKIKDQYEKINCSCGTSFYPPTR